MLPAAMARTTAGKLSQVVMLGASAKEGYSMAMAEKEGKPQGPMQCGPITAGVFYWTTKIGLWTCVAITGGAIIKGGAQSLKGNNAVTDATIASAESFANSSVKFGTGVAMVNSLPVATYSTEAAIAWAGGTAAGLPASFAVPALAAAATANPATAAVVTEVAQAATIVTAKSLICGYVAGLAANIEAASAIAATVGMATPLP